MHLFWQLFKFSPIFKSHYFRSLGFVHLMNILKYLSAKVTFGVFRIQWIQYTLVSVLSLCSFSNRYCKGINVCLNVIWAWYCYQKYQYHVNCTGHFRAIIKSIIFHHLVYWHFLASYIITCHWRVCKARYASRYSCFQWFSSTTAATGTASPKPKLWRTYKET